jgi:hypothetical protein
VAVARDIQAVHAKKPKATSRLLLKIVDGGRPQDSLHAGICIFALVKSPTYARMATISYRNLIHPGLAVYTNLETFEDGARERLRLDCLRIVDEKEKEDGKERRK